VLQELEHLAPQRVVRAAGFREASLAFVARDRAAGLEGGEGTGVTISLRHLVAFPGWPHEPSLAAFAVPGARSNVQENAIGAWEASLDSGLTRPMVQEPAPVLPHREQEESR
jgi:hypothetical protein